MLYLQQQICKMLYDTFQKAQFAYVVYQSLIDMFEW